MTDEIKNEETVAEEQTPDLEDVLAEAEELNKAGKEPKKKSRKAEAELVELEKKLADN